MNQASFNIFHLLRFHGMNRKKLHHYLQIDPKVKQIYSKTSTELQFHFHLNKQQAYSLKNYLTSPYHQQKSIDLYEKHQPLTILDHDFPSELKQIPDPPLILYWKGNKNLLYTNKISVIGTRKPSSNAPLKINRFLTPIISAGGTIVSGLAYGIDAMSHRFAIKNHGNTIAVLGFGYHHIYPASHKDLFHKIVEKGLIISEYPPETKPQKWFFPERNRIISGISSATIIIEAAERSGTMITADQALEQGKEVLAVPDSIFLNQSQGCLKLIQEGATPLVHPEDLKPII